MPDRNDIVTHPFTRKLIKIKARQLCRRSDFSTSDYDDLCQEMVVYLLNKAHLFDPERGNLEAFITNAINTWIGQEFRSRGRDKRRCAFESVSLEGTTVELEGETKTLYSIIGDAHAERRIGRERRSPLEAIELNEAVRRAFDSLEPDDQELLLHVSEHGVASAAREWSRRLNRPVSRRQITRAMIRIRARFEELGLGKD